MILAVDVQYSGSLAFVAGILFEDWNSQSSEAEYVSTLSDIKEYEAGNFYMRELPCILKLLEEHKLKPSIIAVDGYVFLDGVKKPGLGKHLYDSLNYQIEVIGVAKKAFSGISREYEIYRGKSKKPLYITTTGKLDSAKAFISGMYGENRFPFLLKRADQLCREEANKSLHQMS
ncbi:MAG: endonuclease V [Paraglaciecola sp.]|uniref:endonuclease V n=1 Tax=Paraglaciecola sp. TaxID=1920173 RepID=UPI0032974F5E